MPRPTASWSLAILLLGGACRARPPAAPADVLLVTLDTTRADRLGAYGDGLAATPVLDDLARRGLVFLAAQTVAPMTLPAHASLLTGALPPRHGLRQNGAGRLPPDLPTLAEAFQRAGHASAAFVGSFVLDRRFGLDRGFDHYDDSMPKSRRRMSAERPADQVIDAALTWLAAAPMDRPVFLWVHLFDAHAPYSPPAEFAARFPADPYRAEMAFVDRELGRLFEAWSRGPRQGRSRLTAVAGDHGEALGEHGESTHGLLLYESTLRVPLIVQGEAVAAGSTRTDPVSLVDLAPTLAALAGLPAFAAADGSDLSAEGQGEPAGAPQRTLYAETDYPAQYGWSILRSARRGSNKAILGARAELFDLAKDPGELQDLAAQEPRAAVAFRVDTRRIESEAASNRAPAAGPDAETTARLAALGYLAGGTPSPTASAGDSGADPRDRVVWLARHEAAVARRAAGDRAAALGELESLAALDPSNAAFRAELAAAYREAGRTGDAVRLLRQSARANPTSARTWYDLGWAAADHGAVAEAEAAFRRSLELDPGDAEAWNAIGLLATRREEPVAAAEFFERALERDDRNPDIWANLGNARRASRRAADAEEAYRRALQHDPGLAAAWNGLGVLAVEAGRTAEALDAFRRTLEADPRFTEALLNRAVALDMAKQNEAALEAYKAFLDAARDRPEFRVQAAGARQRLAALRLRGPVQTD